MKTRIAPALIAFVAAGASLLAAAQTAHSAHGKAPASSAAAAMPLADGLVKKIDKANRKVTLSHGPLPNGMPAMTMVFKPLDAEWLGKLREGEKIRFTAEDRQGVMTLTQFETIK